MVGGVGQNSKEGPDLWYAAGWRPLSAPDRQAPVKVFLSLPRLLAGAQHLRLTSPEDSKEVLLPGAAGPCFGPAAPDPASWQAAFLFPSQVGWPGESRWQVGLAVEGNSILGAPPLGGLPDVVPEGTLLNMVLRRMYRSRSCSYQLLLEHQRPSCIQGLRWVSPIPFPGQGQAPLDWRGPRLGGRACCWWSSLLFRHGGYTWGGQPGRQSGCSVWVAYTTALCMRVVPKSPYSGMWRRGKELVTSVWLELGARVFFRWGWKTCMKYRGQVKCWGGKLGTIL